MTTLPGQWTSPSGHLPFAADNVDFRRSADDVGVVHTKPPTCTQILGQQRGLTFVEYSRIDVSHAMAEASVTELVVGLGCG